MMRLRIEADFEYDDDMMYSGPDEKAWFFDLLMGASGDLFLHSNEIGDQIGTIKITKITEPDEHTRATLPG